MGGISNLASKHGLTLDRVAEAELKKIMRMVVEPNHQLAKQHPASSQDIMQANMPNMFEDVLALTNVFDRVKSGKLLFRTLVRFTVSSMDGEEKRRSGRVASREVAKMVLLVNKPDEQSVPGPVADFPVSDERKTGSNPETPTSMFETPHEYRCSSLARNTFVGVEHELQLASTLTNSDIERLILLERLTEARLRRQIAERDLAQQRVGGVAILGECAIGCRSPHFVDGTE